MATGRDRNRDGIPDSIQRPMMAQSMPVGPMMTTGQRNMMLPQSPIPMQSMAMMPSTASLPVPMQSPMMAQSMPVGPMMTTGQRNATVGVDVNRDGIVDYRATGRDRNRDGIPDFI